MKNKKLTGAELEAREKQVVTFNDGTQMTLPLLTRWALLIEAINLICDEYSKMIFKRLWINFQSLFFYSNINF